MLALILALAISAPPILPDPTLTPGALDPSVVDSSLTFDDLCPHSNTAARRNVTAAVKREVFAEYGIDPKSGKFEVDHLCSLELGCTNSKKNLWPQSYTTVKYNAHLKDALEDHLHALACRRVITFDEARKVISTNWINAYEKYMDVD